MNTVLTQIEENIAQLSLSEQLWLIERLAQRIRNEVKTQNDLSLQLTEMAHDPEIQNELQMIDAEFAITEADGLETA